MQNNRNAHSDITAIILEHLNNLGDIFVVVAGVWENFSIKLCALIKIYLNVELVLLLVLPIYER